MGRVKRIWYLSPMQAANVQASLRIRTVSPEPPLLAYTSNESRGTFRQKTRSLAPQNGWACAVKICHDGMLKDPNLLNAPQMILSHTPFGAIIIGHIPHLVLPSFAWDQFSWSWFISSGLNSVPLFCTQLFK